MQDLLPRLRLLTSLSAPALTLTMILSLTAIAPARAEEEPAGLEELAGVLMVDEQTLYVLPDDQDWVLEDLEAQPAEDGWFSMTHEVATLLPAGLGVSRSLQTLVFKAILVGGFGRNGLPAEYTGIGPKGVFVRFYRDAGCIHDVAGHDQWVLRNCVATPQALGLTWSQRSYVGPRGFCVRRPGETCAERLEPVQIDFFYQDDACNFLIGAQPTTALSCRVR